MNSYPLNESSLYEMKKYVSLLWCWLIVQLHIFIFKKNFNLRIIALQYCAHICHILTWIIYILKGILILIQGFPGGSDGKESTCHIGYLGSIPGLGRFPGGGHGNPLQYPWLENSHGQRSLVGYSLWDCKESDMTKRLSILGRWGTKGKNWVLYSGWVRGITAQIYLGQNESN